MASAAAETVCGVLLGQFIPATIEAGSHLCICTVFARHSQCPFVRVCVGLVVIDVATVACALYLVQVSQD
jgi:hypothetical protein